MLILKTKFQEMFKKIKWFLIITIIVIVAVVWISNSVINYNTSVLVYDDTTHIPYNKVALLLGTSKNLSSGQPDQYFANRIKAAVDLYNSHKIEIIVISGDNSKKDYNEPLNMKTELIKQGILEDKIYLDYAGFRTFDSVIRMNKIFGQSSFTIISQKFHNQKAVYIALKNNINAIGFNAKDVDAYNGLKTQLREKFARVKVFIDMFLGKQPKFLGEKIEIK